MDPEKGKKDEEETPVCKICFRSGSKIGLMPAPVCACAGSCANICLNCLRQSIAHNAVYRRHVDEKTGEPVCPDCKMPYRNIRRDYVQDDESFMHYFFRTQAVSARGRRRAVFGLPILYAIGTMAAIFAYLPELDRPRHRWHITGIFIFILSFFGSLLYGSLRPFYDAYIGYRNRPATQLQINPSHSRWYPRLSPGQTRPGKNQDVVIDIDDIPPIDDIVAEVFKIIEPIMEPKDDLPPAPLPEVRPPPQIMGPMQFRPNELSRRGRRWSRPQQPRQHQPSARQSQSHTPRRSWTQQPRSRHQRRRQ